MAKGAGVVLRVLLALLLVTVGVTLLSVMAVITTDAAEVFAGLGAGLSLGSAGLVATGLRRPPIRGSRAPVTQRRADRRPELVRG